MQDRFKIVFSAEQGAADLWTYGEEALVEQALQLPDNAMPGLWARAGHFFLNAGSLPLQSRMYSDKACAFALIELFEGTVRPLSRERRRARSAMPPSLASAAPYDGPRKFD